MQIIWQDLVTRNILLQTCSRIALGEEFPNYLFSLVSIFTIAANLG